ncbi:conserved Plasmodium protein, unknown function [Plasmodium sp. gorilla clade G2]|uniref:conserved Plasmodium protein, unknown function n=1 Tax=Plasmodium sp. gorilla clade G2 TaxID=880535 RepID=UPI000D20D305|nr:conserved Plasmodium protein, unknown function [Plasmodium sp. gorilla clade G2]SOV13224.1 conserved Plasmodium protein, unknown function [Plasmodium sp. gorilla clade G2]
MNINYFFIILILIHVSSHIYYIRCVKVICNNFLIKLNNRWSIQKKEYNSKKKYTDIYENINKNKKIYANIYNNICNNLFTKRNIYKCYIKKRNIQKKQGAHIRDIKEISKNEIKEYISKVNFFNSYYYNRYNCFNKKKCISFLSCFKRYPNKKKLLNKSICHLLGTNNDKYMKNLKSLKKVDNTILGKKFDGKEDEIIHEIPEKFLNAFKWALEYRLKNTNCNFMRRLKVSRKTKEPLKSLENYAVGYKENLLAMLQKDKNFFLNVIKTLKSKEYFNFDIYSIFKFLTIDIKFLFYPSCHDESALFYLIFGNLEKAIDFFLKNKHTVNFSLIQNEKNKNNQKEYTNFMLQPVKVDYIFVQNEKGKNKEYIKGGEKNESEEEKNESDKKQNESEEEKNESEEEKNESEEEKHESEEEHNKAEKKHNKTEEVEKKFTIDNQDMNIKSSILDSNNIALKSYDDIKTSASLEEKFNYFLNNYENIEFFFRNYFKNTNELKDFFNKINEKENKNIKEIVNFDMDGNTIIKKTDVLENGINLEMIKKIIHTSPRLSLINKNTIIKRLKHYKNELNYDYKELQHILYNIPQFFAFGNLKKKYKELLYIHENIKEKDLQKLIKIYPRIFTYNIYRTIRPKLLYLILHLNKQFHDTLLFPQYFSYSFRLRIIPRHIAYMNIYYDDYIKYYNDLIKKYNYADFNKYFNDLVYNKHKSIPSIDLKSLLHTSNQDFIKHYNISYYDYVKATQQAKHIHNPFIIY